jgi:hypothetical protein
MKLTESMLRKMIKEEITDVLGADPSVGGDTSSDGPPRRLLFSQKLEACVQSGKSITLKVDVKTFQSNASSSNPTQYTLDGDKRTSYRTSSILPTKGESFKVLKFAGSGPSYSAYVNAEVVGSPSRRISRSEDNSVVTLQHDKFGKFTVALMPGEVLFGR